MSTNNGGAPARAQLAVFISSMNGGGAQRAMLKLAHGIAERDYRVDLVLAKAEGPYLDEVRDSIRVIDLKAGRVIRSLPRLVSYLRRERPAAMVSALNYVNVVALWGHRLAGVPTRMVVSERNTLTEAAPNSHRAGSRLMPRLVKVFYPWADGIVAVSQGVGDDLVRAAHLSPDRVRVIYNPIVTPELRKRADETLDHPWFRPGEPPVVLAVGRLTAQKDFPTLIRAFARVRRKRPARLLVLGEGPDRAELEALVRELGIAEDVALPGFVPNPYPVMKHASVFVLSSRWEGLPGVLIEAMYCGPPLVATDCPSGPREILAGGKYGRLVPVGATDAMAIAIEHALAGRTPRACPESWRPFEMDTVVDQYIDLLLGPPRVPKGE